VVVDSEETPVVADAPAGTDGAAEDSSEVGPGSGSDAVDDTPTPGVASEPELVSAVCPPVSKKSKKVPPCAYLWSQ
jgi:hypothetical protein